MLGIKRSDVQALLIHSYQNFGHRVSRHLFFGVSEADAGRACLAEWLPHLAHAEQPQQGGADIALNLSLTWNGIRALGVVPPGGETAFADEFRSGPEAAILGDLGDSAPGTWWHGQLRTEDVHLVLHLHARSHEALESATRHAREAAARHRLAEYLPTREGGPLTGESLSPNPRELHFGYLDGFSQPAVNWEGTPERPDLMDARQFTLGAPPAGANPAAGALTLNGSYVVLRWLYQDVAAFERFLTTYARTVAPHLPVERGREFLAAKLMGRWRDGTPLVLSPDCEDPARASENFSYAGDPHGVRCPLTAHIRIVNHRDDPLNARNEIMFGPGLPRVIRRGMTYGPRLTGAADDGVDRGIIGLFICASINRQFYPLTRWMRRTNFRDVFVQTGLRRQDPIVGNRAEPDADTAFSIPMPDGADVQIGGLPDFVRTQGTLLLLMPSLSALGRMAQPT